MARKVDVDGITYEVEHVRSVGEWHVYRGRKGEHLGTLVAGGGVVNVDQRGDVQETTALLKRIWAAYQGQG